MNSTTSIPKGILFLCVANSARSQMAEGIARNIFPETVVIQSAGVAPAYVHPLAKEVLSEIDIDISGQTSKSVHDIDPDSVDLVITLCAEQVCPSFLGKAKKLHWPLPNPDAGNELEALRKFRAIRDDLVGRLEELKLSLGE